MFSEKEANIRRRMQKRTSLTDPLQIAEVRLPTGATVGMTLCPGKRQAHAASGSWARDLELDLKVIKDWGAVAVVTAMEEAELRRFGVSDLGKRAEALDFEWHHLPMPDGDIPADSFETLWTYSGHRPREHLRAGRKILVHCRGGLGRTGTIASRLLIELGSKPEKAISDVRKARPGAIETAAQERYVRECTPLASNEVRFGRLLGCLFGGAVGDAFGYEVEFDKLDAIRWRFSSRGIQEPVLHNGKLIVSDDTQMTLFTLEGMLRTTTRKKPSERALNEEVRRAYLDWLETQGQSAPDWKPAGNLHARPALRHRRAPGNTCLTALSQGGRGTPSKPINDSKGCGAVMRVAPLAWLPDATAEQLFHAAAFAGALTHGHPSGFLSGAALAAILHGVIRGEDLKTSSMHALDLLRDRENENRRREVREKVEQALELADSQLSKDQAIELIGQGWVGEEALGIGLYAALKGGSFMDTIACATNHSGDSDSTASIAGQIYGAMFGIAAIPNRLGRKLDIFCEICEVSADARGIH
jgi:ADP-ribosylglycohydrolase/protein-tyrosine phosphatase